MIETHAEHFPEQQTLTEAQGELFPLVQETRGSLQSTAAMTAEAIKHLRGEAGFIRHNNSLIYSIGRIEKLDPANRLAEIQQITLTEFRPGSLLTKIQNRPVTSYKIETRVFTGRPSEENPHPRVYRSSLESRGFATSELVGSPDADFTLKETFGLTEPRGLDGAYANPDELGDDYAKAHYNQLASSLIIAQTVRIAALEQDIDLAAPFDPTAHELMAEWQKRGNVPALPEQAQRLLDATRS